MLFFGNAHCRLYRLNSISPIDHFCSIFIVRKYWNNSSWNSFLSFKLFIYPWKLQNLCHRSFAETAKYLIKIADKGHWIVIILGARYSKLFSIATIGHMGLFPCCIIFHCLYDTLETYKGHFRRRNAIFFKEKRKNLCCHQMVQSFCWPIFQSLKGCYNSKSNEQFRQPFLVSFQLIIIERKNVFLDTDFIYWIKISWQLLIFSMIKAIPVG